MADTGDPPLPNLTVQQLEYLVAVSRSATWAEAAESVGVTPSALSQGLAELERRVGVPLFERQGRRRVIAPAAAPVLAHATAVVAGTRDLARWSADRRSGRAGQLRVGMIDAAAVHHFPTTLRRFRDDRPELDLRLTVAPSGALLEGLRRADLDLAVCVEPTTGTEGLATVAVGDEALAVYGPPGAAPVPPVEWGPWVTFPAGSHTRVVIGRALATLGARFEVVAESHQPEVLREMVRLGLGWTVLPVAQAESGPDPLHPAAGAPVAVRRLVVARRTDAVPDPVADALVDALRDAAPVSLS
ncbi:MAG TPA: LysR family transcriptional regulator [Acidimicrobiales bacterium]|nr:LysR family transcriptional regulator [Acidimicrobiales bacterium]